MLISHFCFALDASKGGVPIGIFMTVKQLSKFGIQNQIISTGNTLNQLAANSPRINDLKSSGVRIVFSITKIQNNYGIGSFKGLKNNIKMLPKPDFVVLHQVYTFSTVLGYLYAKKLRIPYAVQPHGSLTKYHESDSKFLKLVAKKFIVSRILRDANKIIITCDSEKNDLVTSLQAKTYCLPYGAVWCEKKAENNSLGLESRDNIHVIFSGRFDKKKNLTLLIQSLPKVLKKYPDLILDIAGSGTARELKEITRLITHLNLKSKVNLHGWVSTQKLEQLLSASVLLVLPSDNENFAIVVSEALSLGIPCVVSKFVGTSDIVAKHRAGEVIDELTPTSIADGIIKVLKGDKNEYRKAAFEATKDELDWSKIVLKWKEMVALLN